MYGLIVPKTRQITLAAVAQKLCRSASPPDTTVSARAYGSELLWYVVIGFWGLFWLSDEQWEWIAPYLSRDVGVVERVDDRRVISGIVHALKISCAGAIARPNMVLQQRSIIGLFAGRDVASGAVQFKD